VVDGASKSPSQTRPSRPVQRWRRGATSRTAEGSDRPVYSTTEVHGHRLRFEQVHGRHPSARVGPLGRWFKSKVALAGDPTNPPGLERLLMAFRRTRCWTMWQGGLFPSLNAGNFLPVIGRGHRQAGQTPACSNGLQLIDPRQGRLDMEGLRCHRTRRSLAHMPGHHQTARTLPPRGSGKRSSTRMQTEHLQGALAGLSARRHENVWDDRSGCPSALRP